MTNSINHNRNLFCWHHSNSNCTRKWDVAFDFLLFVERTPLKCCRCSSDALNASFCDDPFDPSVLTERQKEWAYVECTYLPSQSTPYGQAFYSTLTPVCKKALLNFRGKKIVARSCSVASKDAPRGECLSSGTPSYIKIESCETCITDGCNAS